MSGNRREQQLDKGWWDGGSKGHGSSKESGGHSSSFPGRRAPTRQGVRIDLDRPLPPKPTEDNGD